MTITYENLVSIDFILFVVAIWMWFFEMWNRWRTDVIRTEYADW